VNLSLIGVRVSYEDGSFASESRYCEKLWEEERRTGLLIAEECFTDLSALSVSQGM
jgi:hypothetical protein